MHEKTEATYRQLSQQLQREFYRHYNLLHRLNLQEKMACLKASNEAKCDYNECIATAIRKMDGNVTALRSRLSEINKQDEKCLSKCISTPNQLECQQQCVRAFELVARNTYSQFYRERLHGNTEYSSW